jgi:hypothetical protein
VEILCNFDEDLLALFDEVAYWEKFHGEFSIPYTAHDICTKRDLLRAMKENVMLIVKRYFFFVITTRCDVVLLWLSYYSILILTNII